MIKTNTTLQTYYNLIDKLDSSPQVFYSRFGDGDIFIMQGKNELLHNHNPQLEKELKESIKINHPNYFVGVNVNYKKEEGMYPGVFEPFGYNNELVNFLIKKEGKEIQNILIK